MQSSDHLLHAFSHCISVHISSESFCPCDVPRIDSEITCNDASAVEKVNATLASAVVI